MPDGGEHCQVCGDAYTDVYRLPDEWWALVTPKPEHPDAGLLCPPCALRRLLVNSFAAEGYMVVRPDRPVTPCGAPDCVVLTDVLPTGGAE